MKRVDHITPGVPTHRVTWEDESEQPGRALFEDATDADVVAWATARWGDRPGVWWSISMITTPLVKRHPNVWRFVARRMP